MVQDADYFTATEQVVFIPGPVGKLQLKTQAKQGHAEATGVAIVCHPHPQFGGTIDNKVVHTVYRAFRDCGLDVVRFNFRGVEASEGDYGEGIGEQQDLGAVIDWLQQVRPGAALYVAGFSFGSYVVADYFFKLMQGGNGVEQSHLALLLLIAPPVHHFGFSEIHRLPGAMHVIQGTADEIVPFEQVQQWCDGLQTDNGAMVKLHLFDGVSHFFHGRLAELKHTITSLFPNA